MKEPSVPVDGAPKPVGTREEVQAWIADREARRCACGGSPTDEPFGYHLASCTATYTGPSTGSAPATPTRTQGQTPAYEQVTDGDL